jgi:hypothetical protein
MAIPTAEQIDGLQAKVGEVEQANRRARAMLDTVYQRRPALVVLRT